MFHTPYKRPTETGSYSSRSSVYAWGKLADPPPDRLPPPGPSMLKTVKEYFRDLPAGEVEIDVQCMLLHKQSR